MEQLVIRLGSQLDESVHWLVWSGEQGEIIASGELPDASELTTLRDRAGNRPIIALIPGSDVLLNKLDLPAKAGHKALAAIPYMMEDDVSTDIDSAFFALGDREGELQNIAVVQKSKMDMWLKAMEQAGLSCNRMVPDILALPLEADSWSLMVLGNNVLARQAEWQGIQGEPEWVFSAIGHYAKHQEDKINVSCLTEVETAAIPNVDMQANLSPLPMEVLAKGAMASKFNLMQGAYKPKKVASNAVKQWRLAAIFAGVALILTVADKAWQASQLSAQATELRAQIRTEFQRAFPETKRIVDVRKQMNQKIKALEGKSSGASMLVMLSQLSGAFADSKVTPQTIRFDKGRAEIRLQAVAANFESLEKFKNMAEQQGFQVEQGAINNRDNLVMGSLVIRS